MLGRVRRTREWERRAGKGSRWPQKPAPSPQPGTMPCAYVLAPSLRRDEKQALACQPLPVTPETLTSLSWKRDWVRPPRDSCGAEGWSVVGRKVGKTPHLKL